MRCLAVAAAADALLDPSSAAWDAVPVEQVDLGGTPLANQPSAFVRRWDPARVGRVKRVAVQAAHTADAVFFRLAWTDDARNVALGENGTFPDGCGILFPLRPGDAPMQEMGAPGRPVNAWFWRADFGDQARNVLAEGLGTTRTTARSALSARARWADGGWTVVLARPLAVPDQEAETVQLAAGAATRIGFAVWEGGNGERGGVKAFSRDWRGFEIV